MIRTGNFVVRFVVVVVAEASIPCNRIPVRYFPDTHCSNFAEPELVLRIVDSELVVGNWHTDRNYSHYSNFLGLDYHKPDCRQVPDPDFLTGYHSLEEVLEEVTAKTDFESRISQLKPCDLTMHCTD